MWWTARKDPRAFARNARRRWEEMFTIDAFIDRVIGIYRSLLHE